ncbi:hypothetical protein V1264_007150 [Littorina saxatilis]|uniref:Major facilitator superfamily (MFS) profile domain-containing protein n=1 Tax=Littorina saxatilis TaxID=31220 RepID=A0AAN9AVK9_9CAEN
MTDWDSAPFLQGAHLPQDEKGTANTADKTKAPVGLDDDEGALTSLPPGDEDFEKLVDSIGGHGPFQIFIWTVGFGTKASAACVFLFMSFAGATPGFWCAPSVTSAGNGSDVTEVEKERWRGAYNDSKEDLWKTCEVNGTTCSSFVFDDSMNTIVGEWWLVCDKKWVSTTITSVQMAGVLLGAMVAGQTADIWGRRKVCIAMLIGQFSFSLANAFSPDWIFFIVTRFGAGVSAGGYLVPYFSLTMEFTDVRWRAFLGAIPAWPVGSGLMALAAWLLHDWQYLGIAIACFTLPFLLAWWFMPESIRWLLVHGRVDEAQRNLARAAKVNGRLEPDENLTRKLASLELSKAKSARVYSFLDLFKTAELAKRSCSLFFVWFSSGAVYYFLAFGAENLSGNLYLNIFLLSIVEIPAMFLSAFLNNKIGRRWTAFLMYMSAGVCAVIVIILIQTGAPGVAINAMVVTSKLAMGGGWAAALVFSAENFPTVVRNIGYGACNVASRVGGIVAPQMVFIYTTQPSIPYAVVAVLMVGSSLLFLTMRETNDQALEDVITMPSSGSSKTHPVAMGTIQCSTRM